MRKFLKLMAVLFLLIFSVILCMFYGNPVSEFLVNKNAEKYIAENYPDTDFEIRSVDYDFKTGNYYVRVESPSSVDSSFNIYAGLTGKIGYDTYEDLVVKRWNTANRINKDYSDAVTAVIMSRDFPCGRNILYACIEFTGSDAPADESVPDYAVISEKLELDKAYDINDMGKKAGHITLHVFDSEVSCERLAEILLETRKLLDKADVSFYVIDCVLEYPLPEDPSLRRDDRVEVMGMFYDDIREVGLTQRVRESDEKAKAYYAALDAEKFNEEAIN